MGEEAHQVGEGVMNMLSWRGCERQAWEGSYRKEEHHLVRALIVGVIEQGPGTGWRSAS